MKIQRRIPPATAPLFWKDLGHSLVGIFSGQRSHERLKAEVREYFGVRYVFLVSSGKAALTLILLALKAVSPKEEVLIPAYTCFSVPSSIVKAGLKVALCDIDPSPWNLSKNLFKIESMKILCA